MPFGLPSATTTVRECRVIEVSILVPNIPLKRNVIYLPKGAHVEPLYKSADQDGHDGEIVCRYRYIEILIQPQFLKL